MSGNSTNSCASNESIQNNQAAGAAHPSLAGADRRRTTADHRRNRLPLQPDAEQNIDAFWLLKLHTGQFGWLNLQPVYPILLGTLTIVATVSGLTMLLRPARTTGV